MAVNLKVTYSSHRDSKNGQLEHREEEVRDKERKRRKWISSTRDDTELETVK